MRLIVKGLQTLFFYTIGFLIIIPLAYFIPKQKNRICFIGRDNGKFLDNTKYLYLYLLNLEESNLLDIYFLTEDKYTYELLQKNNLPVLFYPSLKSAIKMATSNITVVDNYQWIFNLKFFILYFSFKIQLWHGVGFKKLGCTLVYDNSDLPTSRKIIEFFGLYLEQLLPNYDIFVSTSEYYSSNVFKPAFRIKNIIEPGYPRNDILCNTWDKSNGKLFINTDNAAVKQIRHYKKMDFKLVLYAPTFRYSNNTGTNIQRNNFNSLVEFGEENKIKFVFKLHPDFIDSTILESDKIIKYKNDRDIYPILSQFNLLITDYSSIYMDFLYLDKPIIFYPYDYAEYIKNSRSIQFDYDRITPGTKCFNEIELLEALTDILIRGNDDKFNDRNEIFDLAFSYKDQDSSKRIWEIIKYRVQN